MSRIPVYVWDCTLSVKKSTQDECEIIECLNKISKKWCFQREIGMGNVMTLEESSIEDTYDEEYEEYEGETDDIRYRSNTNELNFENMDDDEIEQYIDNGKQNEPEFSESESYESESESDFDSDSNESYDSEIDENPDKFEHWQIRFSLFKKKRKSELLTLIYENDLILKNGYFSQTRTNTMGNMFYVMKLDGTKVAGPWKNDDAPPVKIPYHLQHIKLWSFQRELINRAIYNKSDRKIICVYCAQGNSGKSTTMMYAKCVMQNSIIIPPIMNSFLDLNQSVLSQVYNKDDPDILWLDIPRALPKKKMNDIIAFCEQAKGYVFDTRYSFKERIFYKSPSIVIFTNVKIWEGRDLLSDDRWEIYTIYKKELYLYNEGGDLVKGSPINYPIKENQEKLFKLLMKELKDYFKEDYEMIDDEEIDLDNLEGVTL